MALPASPAPAAPPVAPLPNVPQTAAATPLPAATLVQALAAVAAAPPRGVAAPAARVFAAAITAAGRQDASLDREVADTRPRAAASEPAAMPAPVTLTDRLLVVAEPQAPRSGVTTGRVADAAPPAIAATPDGALSAMLAAAAPPLADADMPAAAAPVLDTRDPRWPAAMVDHIERLRDEADAGSTRIRVVPDALGRIDLALHRHGDGAVEVTMNADRPATQALLSQAQPELTRLAEARGIRLADAAPQGGFPGNGTGSGNASPGGGNAWQTPGGPRRPIAPATAVADVLDQPDAATGRIA